MKKKLWLILDVNYLCWRNFYAMKGLQHEGELTGVVYGFLRDICTFREIHQTHHLAFCFDSAWSWRVDEYPAYKSSRKSNWTEEEKERHSQMRKQIRLLRDDFLPAIGFTNILHQQGAEADDVIASVCNHLLYPEEAIIVSTDKDLYQLISHRVRMWNPKGVMIDQRVFFKEYGIDPVQWHCVKAIAGCHTDDIAGVSGVGDKTAAKFLSGKLSQASQTYRSILASEEIWKRNLSLVKLPHQNCREFFLTSSDNISREGWREVCKRIGAKSLMDRLTPLKFE